MGTLEYAKSMPPASWIRVIAACDALTVASVAIFILIMSFMPGDPAWLPLRIERIILGKGHHILY
jgi:hypothetical protein